MNKSTLAVAALLTVLTASVVSVAYADDSPMTPTSPSNPNPNPNTSNGSSTCSGSSDDKGCAGE